MKRLSVLLALALLAASGCAGLPSDTTPGLALQGRPMTPCTLPGRVSALCGYIKVPEDPSNRLGPSIRVQVAVKPAAPGPSVEEPVFFIAGGPGGSTIQSWGKAAAIFPGLNARHDIVLVDQRGTGGSNQMVLPPIAPGEGDAAYAVRVLTGLSGDPRFYTTSVAMDDLDAVRDALGYSKIDLYGASYGATAVQYYLRQHGNRVHLAVLDGATLLDVPIFELMAASSQRALSDVFGRCRADASCSAAFPDPAGELKAALVRLSSNPVPTTVFDSGGKPIVITAVFLASAIHGRLLAADSAATIPWLIHRAAVGDFDAVAREGSQPPVSTLVMSVEILCSEAWARFDPAAVGAAGAGSYLLATELEAAQTRARACRLVPSGDVPPGDAQPVSSQLPILLLTGEDDPQDPPSNVAGARQQMPNSVTIVVRAQGHTVGNIGCLPSIVVSYFDRGQVAEDAARACVQGITLPAFRLG